MKRKTDEERAFDKTLAQIILVRRSKLNLSQDYIGKHSGVSRTTIGKWERGEKTPISFDFYNVLKLLYDKQSDFWNDFSSMFEKDAESIRKAADKEKYMNYIERTKMAKGKK